MERSTESQNVVNSDIICNYGTNRKRLIKVICFIYISAYAYLLFFR